MTLYTGPVIDPHIHLWEYGLGRHAWLMPQEGGLEALGDLSPLRRDRLPRDYLSEAAGQSIVATVHIEAVWDPADPVGETRWLASLDRPAGMAARWIASAALEAPDVAAVLDAHLQAAGGNVVGVRSRLSWHPDPAKRFCDRADMMDDPAWRAGAQAVAACGLHLEVMIYPHQADDLARVAAALPDLRIVVNHCASPIDRTAEGIEVWRNGLRTLAALPNVLLKVSNVGAYVIGGTREEVCDIVRGCIDAFGPERSMFASDWPVVALHTSLDRVFADFRAAVQDLAPADQSALFHDTAARIYRL